MAKDIKTQLWNQHFASQIPELTDEKNEQSLTRMGGIKLPNPERNTQLVHGLVTSCETAWENNSDQKDEIIVDVSSLWKACTNKNDIYKLTNSLQYHIHCAMPNVYAKVSASCDEITVRLIDKATMKPPFVEEWLTSKVNQRQTELTFNKLESFYKAQPVWVQRKHNFLKFIKTLFETIKKTVDHLVSFKIDKSEKKVVLQYAS